MPVDLLLVSLEITIFFYDLLSIVSRCHNSSLQVMEDMV